MMESLMWFVAVGVITGTGAQWVMPGPRAGGPIVAMIVALAGSMVSGIVWVLLHRRAVNPMELGPAAIILAWPGALFALLCYRSWAIRLEPADAHIHG